MELDRRGFLKAGAASLALLWSRRGRASPEQTALAIHRATRNTRWGAIGTRLRRSRGARARFKDYPGRARLVLPQPSFDAGRPLFAAARDLEAASARDGTEVGRRELARLLFLTNGVTDRSGRVALRAAPSAGALYSGEVYAVVERVRGLPSGVYSYHAGDHALVMLREGAFLAEVGRATEEPQALAGAAAAVLLTNVFERYTGRYANRGYRYALIDSGHIGENLRVAAWELGLALRMPLRFEDQRLNDLLGVDGREEAVCALHLLGPAEAPRRESSSGAPGPRLVERQLRGPLPAGLSAPDRYHEATKLVWSGEGTDRERREQGREAASGPPHRPRDPVVATSAHAAIRQRRSAARFDATPMQRQALLQVLAFARGESRLHLSGSLDLYCVAHRVAETPSGLYRYDTGAHRLEPRSQADLAAPLVRACLGQAKSGEAAAALIAVARLDEASARGGARAYRDLLLDAGATAQRIYLGAEALGLAARNLAAFYDDDLDALLGLDGEHEVAVHLTALGPGA